MRKQALAWLVKGRQVVAEGGDRRPPEEGPPEQGESGGFGRSRTASNGVRETPENPAQMHGLTLFFHESNCLGVKGCICLDLLQLCRSCDVSHVFATNLCWLEQPAFPLPPYK